MKYFICALLLALYALFASAPASADNVVGTKDSAVKYYANSYESLDIAYYMDKIKAVFFTDEFKAKHPMAGMFEGILTAAGYFAIERYDIECEMSRGMMTIKETMVINNDYPNSFVSRYIAVPNGEWRFDKFLSDGDYVFLLAVNGFKEKGPIFMDYMMEAGKAANEASGGQANINFGPLGMIQMKPEMLASLGNEMDIVLFDPPDFSRDIQGPEDFNAAIMIPVEDYEGAKKLVGMAGGMLGFNPAKPGHSTLGWTFYPIMDTTVAIGLSHDWFVIVTNYKKFSGLARRVHTKELRPVAKGSTYMRIDVDRLYNEMGKPLIAKMKKENPRSLEPQFAQLFDIKPGTDLGAITFFEAHRKLKAHFTTTMDDDVFNLMAYAFGIAMDSLITEKMAGNCPMEQYPDYPVMAPPPPDENAAGGRDEEIPLKNPGAGNVYF